MFAMIMVLAAPFVAAGEEQHGWRWDPQAERFVEVGGPAIPAPADDPAPTPPAGSGLNFSSQRPESPQAGELVWVRADTELVTNTYVLVYTGTDFPRDGEPSYVKRYPNGGWLVCNGGSFITKYGYIVDGPPFYKFNGRPAEEGLFYWGRNPDGSYDWHRMSIEEYRATGDPQSLHAPAGIAGFPGHPYAPNCVVDTLVGIERPPYPGGPR
ncbi:MAG: hypothetical protein COV75_08180 [Candidatus Omnitrophica bacterium CG11_big_fil_rev_8_21_14_0_20_63_9]|nr:MAG: hypothetical protein COV75_08180 [Candidatus Omnitrophica bacterium CG11_big_fil_rev_8_21_14_0_20_63_9]